MKSVHWYAERTERLGRMIDSARELREELDHLPVSATDPLCRALTALSDAQEHLTYELGVAARVEHANRARDAADRG